jgi:hypothetical protein
MPAACRADVGGMTTACDAGTASAGAPASGAWAAMVAAARADARAATLAQVLDVTAAGDPGLAEALDMIRADARRVAAAGAAALRLETTGRLIDVVA